MLYELSLVNFSNFQARPLFKDRKKFRQMADPTLDDQYPTRGLYQTLAICAMCLQELPNERPAIHDIVHALTYLASKNYKESHSSQSSRTSTRSSSPAPRIFESDDETKA
ncbi:hypothetical protein LIER_43099 [Lithospermum erythrorhizon]|uniref:Uncharacterized protein n=1 Tax=Lithospermum erythrorhizon TaxID=34254 RepID=A0AAV3PFJ1_LITER